MENQEKPLLVSIIAGNQGAWRIERMDAVVGESLPSADRLEVVESPSVSSLVHPAWVLRGVTSNVRYTNRAEVEKLKKRRTKISRKDAKVSQRPGINSQQGHKGRKDRIPK